MANFFVGTGEWSDAATLHSFGSERISSPAANLLDPEPRLSYRTIGLTTQFVRLQRAVAADVGQVSAIAWNGTTTSTFRVRLGTSQAEVDGASASYDSNNALIDPSGIPAWISPGNTEDRSTWGRIHSLHVIRPGGSEGHVLAKTWLRVDLAAGATSPAEGDFIVGAILVGRGWRITPNVRVGSTAPGFRKRGEITDLPAGGVAFARQTPVPRWRFTVWAHDAVSIEAFKANAYRIDRLRADHSPVILCSDTDPADGHLIQRLGYGMLVFGEPILSQAFHYVEQSAVLEGWI